MDETKETIDNTLNYAQEELIRKSREEIMNIIHEYPIMDNVDLSRLNKADREATEKMIEWSKEQLEKNIENIFQKSFDIINASRNDNEERETDKNRKINKNKKEITKNYFAQIAKPINRLVEKFKDVKIAFENAVDKIKDDIQNGVRQKMDDREIRNLAKLDKNKIRASLKAIDATTIESRALNEVHRDAILKEIAKNQQSVEKITQQVEKKYLESVRKREKAYSIDMIKTGFKMWGQSMYKNPDTPNVEFKSKEEFGMMPDEKTMTEIRGLLNEMQEYRDKNTELLAELSIGDMEQFKKECDYGYKFEPDEGIDSVRFNFATEELRKVYAKENDVLKGYAEQGFIVGNGLRAYDYGVDQLQQISLGIKEGVDISKYADPEIYADKMAIVRTMAIYECIPDDLTIDKIKEMDADKLMDYANEQFRDKVNKLDYVKELSGGEVDFEKEQEAVDKTYNYLKQDMDLTKCDLDYAQTLDEIVDEMREMEKELQQDVGQIMREEQEKNNDSKFEEKDIDDDFDR